MDTLFVSRDCTLERDGGTLMVRPKAQPARRFPVQSLRHVVVAGEARLTTSVLLLLARTGVRLTVLDHHGNTSGAFESVRNPASGTVRLAQARHVLDPELRLDLARRLRGRRRPSLSAIPMRGQEASSLWPAGGPGPESAIPMRGQEIAWSATSLGSIRVSHPHEGSGDDPVVAAAGVALVSHPHEGSGEVRPQHERQPRPESAIPMRGQERISGVLVHGAGWCQPSP